MKVRKGFVSNSSSSSFLVALPYQPTSAKDLQNMLFKSGDMIKSYRTTVSASRAAKALYYDPETATEWNCNGRTIEREEALVLWDGTDDWDMDKALRHARRTKGLVPCGECDKKSEEACLACPLDQGSAYSAWHELRDAEVDKLFDDLPEGGVVVYYNLSDECGSFWSAMEHGGTFYRVPHLCKSHH